MGGGVKGGGQLEKNRIESMDGYRGVAFGFGGLLCCTVKKFEPTNTGLVVVV